ncbi:MAG: DUF2062 domain-containing protein [Rhizobiaceae bacterium]|nr:DUF2062 domain-containing protein [Rhizobiaceae bacterium]
MLFDRRNPPNWRETLRISIWPRRSWARSGKYVAKRIMRLTASPHAVAAGVAAGVFSSFTPFMGFHFLIAFAISYVVAGNFLAAGLGTFIGNPVTFPFIWGATYTSGNFILHGKSGDGNGSGIAELGNISWTELGWSGLLDMIVGVWEPLIKPMLVGGIPIGTAFAITAYILTRWASRKFRDSRLRKKNHTPPPPPGPSGMNHDNNMHKSAAG